MCTLWSDILIRYFYRLPPPSSARVVTHEKKKKGCLNYRESPYCCYYCTNKIHIQCAHRNKSWHRTDAVTITFVTTDTDEGDFGPPLLWVNQLERSQNRLDLLRLILLSPLRSDISGDMKNWGGGSGSKGKMREKFGLPAKRKKKQKNSMWMELGGGTVRLGED